MEAIKTLDSFYFPFAVTGEQETQIRALTQKVVVFGHGSHPHPVLHCEREIGEATMIAVIRTQGFSEQILDVGANPNRHSKYGRGNVWSCCPTLTHEDVHRRANTKSLLMCECLYPSCSCVVPTSVMFVHSLYYIDKHIFLKAVRESGVPHYALIHPFPGEYGEFHGEATYNVGKDGVCVMQVVGNSSAYKHNDLSYLYESSGEAGVCWTIIKTVGSAIIVKFLPDSGIRTIRTGNFLRSVGPKMVYDHARSPLVDVGNGEMVPLSIIQDGKVHYDTLVGDRAAKDLEIRKWVKSTMKNSQVAVSLQGYKKVYDTIVEQIVPHDSYSWAQLTVAGKFCLCFTVYFMFYNLYPPIEQIFLLTWDWQWKVYTIIICLKGVSILGKLISFNFPELWKKQAVIKDWAVEFALSVPKFRCDASFILGHFSRKSRWSPLYRYGPCVGSCVPYVHADTPYNEQVAIKGRAIKEVPKPRPELWYALEHYFLAEWRESMASSLGSYKRMSFEEWNSRFRNKPGKFGRHLRAQARLSAGASVVSLEACTSTAFVKREKLIASEPGGKQPRLIQAPSDLHKVVLGPFIVSVTRFFQDFFDIRNKIYFAIGGDASVYGQWFQNHWCYEQFVECDFSRFDSTISTQALRFEQLVYGMFSPTDLEKTVLAKQLVRRVRSSHGHVFTVPATRGSGDPNTTCGNTLICGMAMAYAFNVAGVKDFKIIVGGDDSVVALNGEVDLKLISVVLNGLGFVPEMKLCTIEQVTFYSSVPVRTEEGCILTPKLGKTLVKFGYSVVPHPSPSYWLKQVATGGMALFHHIPFMFSLFENLRRQTSNSTRKGEPVAEWSFQVSKRHNASSLTYGFLNARYGLSYLDVMELKGYLGTLPQKGVMDHPLIDRILAVDGDRE